MIEKNDFEVDLKKINQKKPDPRLIDIIFLVKCYMYLI